MKTLTEVARFDNRRTLTLPREKEVFEKLLKPLSVYEWFDSRNMNTALQSFEASAHAAVNGIGSQMQLHAKDALACYNKDRAEKSIAAGRDLNIDVKLFAVIEPKEGLKAFTVRSGKWDWKVMPLDMSNERVPGIFLKRVTLLSGNGISFERWAIAVPSMPNSMPLNYAIKNEAVNTFKSLARIGARISAGTGKAAGKAARRGIKVMAPVVNLSERAIAVFLRDPVLLGCYGKDPVFTVEIGRWE